MKRSRALQILGISILLLGALLAVALLTTEYWAPRNALKKPQKITCINNLKQIGLSMRIWAGDHGDEFPFNVSTNGGGTMEFCGRDKEGFDTNAFLHLQVMSNELNSPIILVCPEDRSRKPAADFASLQAPNVTYRLRTSANISDTNAMEILAVCPVDGNILYCDGHVEEHKRK